jgi:hypothetical protein
LSDNEQGRLIGRLRVYGSGVGPEWRNVRQWRTEDGPRYTVEGWSGRQSYCPLQVDHADSRWFIDPDLLEKGEIS